MTETSNSTVTAALHSLVLHLDSGAAVGPLGLWGMLRSLFAGPETSNGTALFEAGSVRGRAALFEVQCSTTDLCPSAAS